MAKKKKKTNKIRNAVVIGVIAVLSLSLTAISVYGSSWAEKIIQVAGEKYGELLYSDTKGQIDFSVEEEETFGRVMGEKWVKQGNRVTFIESGQFIDASTTLFAFMNPFGSPSTTAAAVGLEQYALDYEGTDATSTVVSVTLDITGVATSTMKVICGAAATLYSDPIYDIFNADLPTSTMGVLSNNQATTTAGFAAGVGTGTTAQILLTHNYSYFTCHATGTPDTEDYWANTALNGLLGGNNTFDGYYSIEITKNLQ